jgi:hypothetical protein
VTLVVAVLALVVARWPLNGRAAGWDRAGPSWGEERTGAAARTGRWVLHAVDPDAAAWRYLEQTVTVTGGRSARAVAWLRSSRHGDRAQLVVNDDVGLWVGQTVLLSPRWRRVTVAGRLAPTATRVRLAIVPGDGTVTGTGVVDADDVQLWVDGVPRLANGGAEEPRRLGRLALAGAWRYADAGRLLTAVPGGLADAGRTLRRAWRGLTFTYQSFWGGFGWLAIWPEGGYYDLAALLTLFALLANAVALVAPTRLTADPATAVGLRICAAAGLLAVTIAVAGLMAGAPPDRLPQGRYLVAAVVPLALPAVGLADRLARRFGPTVLAASALFLDLTALVHYIWPAYHRLP